MGKVEVELSEGVLEQLQKMVEKGYFDSMEEAVRGCIAVVLALTQP